MDIEEKIINEIHKFFTEKNNLDANKINKINKLIVYQSVKTFDREKTEREAINYIENKLYDLFTK
jgi:hypothetical protein